MKLFLTILLSFIFINSVSAYFQDECATEVGIVNTFQILYSDELNKAMIKVKELDPAIELLDKQIAEIRMKVDSELVWVTSSRIAIEKIDRTKELTQRQSALLREQDIYMRSADNYKKLLNNALNNQYVCRYNIMMWLINDLQNVSLSSESKLEILNKALYYADNEKQKNLILWYIANLHSTISFEKPISTMNTIPTVSTPIKKLSLKEKNALRLKALKEKRRTQKQVISNY